MTLPAYHGNPWIRRRQDVSVGAGPVVVQRYVERGAVLVVVEARGRTVREASRRAGEVSCG